MITYAKNPKKIAKNLTLALSLSLKIVENIRKYLEASGYFIFIFSIFSKIIWAI